MVPPVLVYLPGGHLVCAVQESVLKLTSELIALKNPGAQDLHWGCVVASPAILVNFPGGHLVWAMHPRLGQPNICGHVYKV